MWTTSSYSKGASNCVQASAAWRTSSYSGHMNSNCVQACAAWRKSSRSTGGNGGCVDVTFTTADGDNAVDIPEHKASEPRLILIRDSKDPSGPVLAFNEAEWTAFIAGVKDGEFDNMLG